MNWLRPWFSGSYWLNAFSTGKAVRSSLEALGALWLFIEVVSFFSQNAATTLKGQWLPIIAISLSWAIWANRPIHQVSYRLNGRDVIIEIRVGDIFKMQGSIVVPTNRTFDTELSPNLISLRSIQGAFTKKYYDNTAHLNHDIESALEGVDFEEECTEKIGKKRLYAVGTCIKLAIQGVTSYWLAIAKLNNHGRAQGTVEDIRTSLPVLWDYVSEMGDYGTVLIPVIGSGYSRIVKSREEIIREILKSFVAACAARKPCEKLAIVVSTSDYYDYAMSLDELGGYLLHLCKYTIFEDNEGSERGSPIS
jgi:hypothetical protein